jgi:hypothetical protein
VTNPRTRLAAEVGWFPGTSPAKVIALVKELRRNPALVRTRQGLNALTMANLMSSAMELIDPDMSAEGWAGWLVGLGEAEDEINAAEVLRDINEDRKVAGFPEVRDVALIEEALAEQRRHYKEATLSALENVASEVLVEAITRAVAKTTSNGERHAPLLIEDIASAYELRASHAIEKGATSVLGIVEAVRAKVSSGDSAVSPEITRLEQAVRQWDKLAQPAQLLAKSRGQEHDTSRNLAYAIRSLCIDLVNEHSMIDQGQRITTILADVFAELPEVFDRLESDREALQNLKEQRDEGERRGADWADAITYRAEIGVLVKNTLSISPTGVSWKNKNYPLETVTRVRWGAVRRSVNGIPTGTTYTIAFGDGRSEAICETRQQRVFDEFVPRVFRAVGFRILVEMLATIGEGRTVQIGTAVVDDMGVTVPRHVFFGRSGPVRLQWHELHVWSGDGSFFIGSKMDKKAYAQMPYLSTANVHFLEYAIRLFFKSKHERLSQLFGD